MQTDPLLRLLDIVRRELDATDARLQLGGRDPSGDRVVSCLIEGGFRLVVELAAPPRDRATLEEKLESLVSSFSATLASELAPRRHAETVPAVRALTEELAVLCERIQGEPMGQATAVVVDIRSPEIWAASHSSLVAEDDVRSLEQAALWFAEAQKAGVDLPARLVRPATVPPPPPSPPADIASEDDAPESQTTLRGGGGLDLAGAEEVTRLRTRYPDRGLETWQQYFCLATAVREGRLHFGEFGPGHAFRGRHMWRGDHRGFVVRPFATIYLLVVAVEGTLSELHVDGAILHALPMVERLTLSLPPRDPPPRGGRVFRLVPR